MYNREECLQNLCSDGGGGGGDVGVFVYFEARWNFPTTNSKRV